MQVASITLAFTLLSALVLIEIYVSNNHYVKSVRIRSFSGLYFPAFGPNTEIYKVLSKIYEVLCLFISVFSPNAGKCGPEKFRIRTLFTKLLFESSYYRLVCNTCFNPLSANLTKWSNILKPFCGVGA